jgi:hypothetical protein
MASRGSCLKDALAAVGCLTLVVLAAAGGWRYRAQVVGLYRSLVHGPQARAVPSAEQPAPPSPGEPARRLPEQAEGAAGPQRPAQPAPNRAPPAAKDRSAGTRQPAKGSSPSGPSAAGWAAPHGRPSAEALASARRKRAELERPGGPAFVVLDAAELASLIVEGLGPAGRETVDSVEVTLGEDRLAVDAAVRTAVLGASLGPLAAILNPWEPVRVSGPARVAAVGALAFEPDSFVVRAFPFPSQAVPALINRITGRPDGIVPIPVPPAVGDLRIRPDGVTFYRRAER